MTAAEIAECLQMALSTVSRWLKRIGLGKRSRLEPPEPPNRYERKRPGELVHVDVKKLGRIAGGAGIASPAQARQPPARRRGRRRRSDAVGWEFVHVCVDDATRLAYVEVLADETGRTAAGFLRRAVAWFQLDGDHRRAGDERQRLLLSLDRSTPTPAASSGCEHLFTQPYRPRTNGKAERFIQTLQNRWAYGAIYGISAERTGGATRLARPLQLHPTSWLPRPPTARSSARRAGTTSLPPVEYVLLVLILLALVVFVTAPLRRGERAPQAASEERLRARVAELETRKEAKYREIRDASLDHSAGKLDGADFESVDAELRREAIAILKELDEAEAELRRSRSG